MEIKQQLRLSQQLVMTPQLQQAIKLLQLSRLELIDEVRKELDNNPVLADEDIEGRGSGDDPRQSAKTKAADAEFERAATETADTRESEKAVREVDWEKFLENRSLQQSVPGNRGGFDELPPIEQNLTKPRSLQDHLYWQLTTSDFTEGERRFAELVIGNLDEKGYLDLEGVERPDGTRTPDLTIEDLAEEAGLHPEDAPDVLELIQNFDPIGVGSRDLRECLLVQAKAIGFDEIETEIINGHLHHLEKHNYQAIAREMKIPVEEVYEAAKEIQKLESRPARNFTDTDDRSIGITPDVYVVKDGNELRVQDNDKGVQRLYINEALTKKLMQDPQLPRSSSREAEERAVAHQEHRAAAPNHLQGHRQHRAVPARVPGARRRASAPHGPQGRRGGHRHARVHGQPGDHQQVRPHSARDLRAQVFLQHQHPERGRRRRIRCGERQGEDPAAHLRGGPGASAERPAHRADPQGQARYGHRATHGDQVPRDARTPVLERSASACSEQARRKRQHWIQKSTPGGYP